MSADTARRPHLSDGLLALVTVGFFALLIGDLWLGWGWARDALNFGSPFSPWFIFAGAVYVLRDDIDGRG